MGSDIDAVMIDFVYLNLDGSTYMIDGFCIPEGEEPVFMVTESQYDWAYSPNSCPNGYSGFHNIGIDTEVAQFAPNTVILYFDLGKPDETSHDALWEDATDICIDHQSGGCQCATGIEVVDRGNIHDIYRDPNDVACSGGSCLGECEGDCDTDEHCKQGLACWHRSGWDDPVPPGCTGTAHFQSHDYCYDPSRELQCPSGSSEVEGDLNDIDGCGLTGCDDRYGYSSAVECLDACNARSDCASFTWCPMSGDKNHPGVKVCTLYSDDTPNQEWGPAQIMCIPGI